MTTVLSAEKPPQKDPRSGRRRRLLWRLLLLLSLVLVALLIVIGVLYNNWSEDPLPQHEGELTVSGLQATVEVLRDGRGIPHIYASNAHDLFMAQGFVQAQDRWWQMELHRHLASGRMGELVGRSALANDLRVRAFGLRRVAEEELALYDEQTRAYLQAFSDGVNAYLSRREPGDLAFEYNILDAAGMELNLRPWTPVDTLVWARFISFGLSANMNLEMFNAHLTRQVGPEKAADFFPSYPYGQKPSILQSQDVENLPDVESPEQSAAPASTTRQSLSGPLSLPALAWLPPYNAGLGSNSWVASGALTESGEPLLANDPHLDIEMPSFWYQIGLHCTPVSDACPYDVTGFTFSPWPAVILGHNAHIAWGATVAGVDVQDLYQLRIADDDPLQYEWNGSARGMTVREETFNFADSSKPITLTMRVSHLGPIINDYELDPQSGEIGNRAANPVALRWTGLETGPFFNNIFALSAARNWDEFRAALQEWHFAPINLTYADSAGNIGYIMPGRVPLRAEDHSGTLPAPGWDEAYEWQGLIPFEQLPSIFNPERGYIISANQNVAPPEYYEKLRQEMGTDINTDIQALWQVHGYRAQRIEELLHRGAPFNVADFQEMQGDNLFLPALEIAPYLEKLQLDDEELVGARDRLLLWDEQMEADSDGAALYMLFWSQLVQNLYYDELGQTDFPATALQFWPTVRLLEQPNNPWWDDTNTSDTVETRDDILRRALRLAYEAARESLGSDEEGWTWGSLHTATFASLPLGQLGLPLLSDAVNRGPYPVDGGCVVLNNNCWGELGAEPFAVQTMPSMRMVVDLNNLQNSAVVNSTGQSAHHASDHYGDQLDNWLQQEYAPMLWQRQEIEAATVERMILRPQQ